MADGYNFHAVLTSDGLVSEVAAGTFSFKNKIKASSIRVLWEKLGFFIAETLKSQKGVLLPNLGNFRVGPVVGESKKKIRATFTLLEGRYGSISQERPKYVIGGKAPIVQPNYGLLSAAAAVHRGTGQRLLAELLQRLGVHILSSRPIKVDFPCLGKLLTNRVGRIEFVFDPLFSEFFERENYAVVKEMPYSALDYEVQKGLQAVTLEDPPLIKSPMARPVSATSGVSRKERLKQQEHAPYRGGLLDLLKLCKEADRTISGCVPRLRLEQWLHQQCRQLLVLLNGATLMDLLDRHTHGKASKQIMYRQFLDALDAALAAASGFQQVPVGQAPLGREDSPDAADKQQLQDQGHWGMDGEGQVDQDEDEDRQAGQEGPQGQGGLRSEASAKDLIIQVPVSPMMSPMYQQHAYQMQPSHQQQEQQQQQQAAAEPDSYMHYVQNQLSPRSRGEYDAFNRAHFERLNSARGTRGAVAAKRAVTPKVGEEPLNLQEFQAVRNVSPGGSRGRTPAAVAGYGHSPAPSHSPDPYHHHQQQQGSTPSPASQQQQPWARPVPGMQFNQAPPQQQQPRPAWPATPSYQQQPPAHGPVMPYSHQPQVMHIMRSPAGSPNELSAPGPGHQQQLYNIITPAPVPQQVRPLPQQPLSQYDILMERDPAVKARLKAQYAAALQDDWGKQIREKEELEGVLQEKEQMWPFGPVGVPMDKRPVSAISRPQVSPRRGNKTPK